jgi:hypothetical protein
MSERLAALAQHVENDSFFLAEALSTYARAEGLSDDQLAQRLGCAQDQLDAVRLCRRPRGSAREFQHDVDRIAAVFQIDAKVLAEVVRRDDSLRAFRGVADSRAGYLMAARDFEPNEAGDEPEEADD